MMIANNYTFISFVEKQLLELIFEVGGYKDLSVSIRPIENGPYFIVKTHKQWDDPSNIEVYVTDYSFGISIGKSSTQEFKECKPLLEYIEKKFSIYYGIETSSERTTSSWFKNLPLEEQAHWYEIFSTLPKKYRHILDMIGLGEEALEGLNNKFYKVKNLLLKEDYEPLLELKDGNIVISLLGHPLINLTPEMFLAITNNHNKGETND